MQKALIFSELLFATMQTKIAVHPINTTTTARAANLIILGQSPVLFDTEGPVNMQDILVQGQHEYNQHEQSVEDGKEEYRLVSQLLETSCNFSLQSQKNIRKARKLNYSYLACFREGGILADAKRPVQVDFVLVQCQQEDDQNKNGVHHAGSKDDIVAQLGQAFGKCGLKVGKWQNI